MPARERNLYGRPERQNCFKNGAVDGENGRIIQPEDKRRSQEKTENQGKNMNTVHFVGAGPGAPDLITLRGQRHIESADVIIYAGSLVNPALLDGHKQGCRIYNSAQMTLEEIIDVIQEAAAKGEQVVRLHTGDPSIYGAVAEQMRELDKRGISYDSTPGVSSFLGAAAALNLEYTIPERTQTVILTRIEGKTPMPPQESLERLASHGCTMVLFLSCSRIAETVQRLVAGGYAPGTPAALVYKATWPEEKVWMCTLETLEETAARSGITKTALIIVGEALLYCGMSGDSHRYDDSKAQVDEENRPSAAEETRSRLYDPSFETEFRKR